MAAGKTGPGRSKTYRLPLSPLKYALILTGLAVALYIIGTGFLGLGRLGAVSLASLVIPFLTRMYLRMRREQFLRQVQAQLPEIALMACNALRAGYSLSQALAFVAEQARPPAREIFRRCREELDLGRPLDDSVSDLVRRYDSPDLRLMLATMLV